MTGRARTRRLPALLARRSLLRRVSGWALVALGVAIMFAVTLTGYSDLRILPGRQDGLYFMGGVVVAAAGTWWLGLFDRNS